MNQMFHELTNSEWEVIEKIINKQRNQWHSLRTIINAIFGLIVAVLRGGN